MFCNFSIFGDNMSHEDRRSHVGTAAEYPNIWSCLSERTDVSVRRSRSHAHLSGIERQGKAPFTVFKSGFCSSSVCDVLYLSDVIERRALSTTKNRAVELDVD